MDTQADIFFQNEGKWREEFSLLREIITENDSLVEDFKWMHPCYTFNGKNVVLIHGFKNYCALLFHKGALLNDSQHLLIQQTENVQSARQLRFSSVDQIAQLAAEIKEFVAHAIELEKQGKKVELKKVSDYPVPEEFRKALEEDEELNSAFNTLTPGRQKAYLYYFNQAKQAKTRDARIEKNYQRILSGKGLDD